MAEFRLAATNDGPEWNEFVNGCSESTIYHLFEWRAIYQEAYRRRCYYLFSQGQDSWSGVLPLVHLQGPLSSDRLISLPYVDRGGALAASTEARADLVSGALSMCTRLGARGVEIRDGKTTRGSDKEKTTRYRFLLPLDGIDDLWKRIGPKVRNQVRKAEKSGLVTRQVGLDKLDEFYPILSSNMHRLGSPVHSDRFFRAVLEYLGDRARLYITYDSQTQPVAGCIALRFRESVTVPWASSSLKARSLCPNHSLYWQVLQESVDEGGREFDFGRSSIGTGTYRFKKQWNAELVPLTWTSLDRHGNFVSGSSLSPQRHTLLVGLWSSLPESAATRLGPIIRRQLPN